MAFKRCLRQHMSTSVLRKKFILISQRSLGSVIDIANVNENRKYTRRKFALQDVEELFQQNQLSLKSTKNKHINLQVRDIHL